MTRKIQLITLSTLLIFTLCLSTIMTLIIPAFASDLPTADKKDVTVGFFEFDGYHDIYESGIKSGYGYEFIQMIKHYNNWNIQYVGYEKSWAESLKMLENGEIDILTSARKTAEREAIFDYSQQPIGYSTTLLTSRAGDSRYTIGDIETYNGIRVGMIENNTRNQSFDNFAKENNISYTTVIYKEIDDMVSDLQNGINVDAIVTSSLRSIKNETILEEFDPSPFYAIVKKGNSELLSEINYAISLLDIRHSGWQAELRNKYYTPNNGDLLAFSAVELAYLDELHSKNVVLKVVSNPDAAPYSYYENGTFYGIAPKIFEELTKRVGLKYEYIPTTTYSEYYHYLFRILGNN